MRGRSSALLALAAIASVVRAEGPATLEQTDTGVRVSLGGETFAEYRVTRGASPVVWPIYSPGGHEMTRRSPLAMPLSGESLDHPHHRSLWFAHGDVNGHDFWHNFGKHGRTRPRIDHRGYLRQEVNGDWAVVETANDWVADGQTLLTDVRTLRFGVAPSPGAEAPAARCLRFTIRLTAVAERVTFGDTKEGTFAVRVPGAMKVKAGLGGRLVNDRGQANGDAWGQPARWVLYSGPLTVSRGDKPAPTGGIAMMSAPDNPRPRCRWHVREYGLFAANPFGEQEFPKGETAQGPVTLARGESLTLRYAAVFYQGEAGPQAVEGWYNEVFNNHSQPTDVER